MHGVTTLAPNAENCREGTYIAVRQRVAEEGEVGVGEGKRTIGYTSKKISRNVVVV